MPHNGLDIPSLILSVDRISFQLPQTITNRLAGNLGQLHTTVFANPPFKTRVCRVVPAVVLVDIVPDQFPECQCPGIVVPVDTRLFNVAFLALGPSAGIGLTFEGFREGFTPRKRMTAL